MSTLGNSTSRGGIGGSGILFVHASRLSHVHRLDSRSHRAWKWPPATWTQAGIRILPHQYPISRHNTSPEELIHLSSALMISSNGPPFSSNWLLTRGMEMAYRSLDRNGYHEFRMPPFPISPQNTPTQECIHLAVSGGIQPRSPTRSPIARSLEIAYPNLPYQEFHSTKFFVSAQNSSTQQLEQLSCRPSVHSDEFTFSPMWNLEHLPCPCHNTGVNRDLLLSGPIDQPSRNPETTFDEHAIPYPTLYRHGLRSFSMLNLDRPDFMPISHLSDLETLALALYRVGMISDPTKNRIAASDCRTVTSI